MTYDNSGIISKNDRKETDKHPDISGSATVNGVEYWLSGWKKEKNGRGFYTLSFKPKDARTPERKELDDEIPF